MVGNLLHNLDSFGPDFPSQMMNNPSQPLIGNTLFDTCGPVGPSADTFGGGEPASIEPSGVFRMTLTSCSVRKSFGDGIRFHGTCGDLRNVDISECVGDAIHVYAGGGTLNLRNVGTTGVTNTGFGIHVDSGMEVTVDKATSCPAFSGVGDGFTLVGDVVTLNDATGGAFSPEIDGAVVVVSNSPTPGNDGAFTVTFIDANNIEYTNPNGATELGTPAWTTGAPLTGTAGAMLVGAAAPATWAASPRTWSDFRSGVSTRPALNEFDLTAVAGASGTLSNGAPVPAFMTGTGSRLSQK
jgi:hypothetical protein